jgi:hypothetical protein
MCHRGIDCRPVPVAQQPGRQRKDRRFLPLHVAAESGDVRPAGRLDVLARLDRPVDDVVESTNQCVSEFLQARVLLGQLVDNRTGVDLTLLDPRKRQIFFGMMQHVGVMRHVEHDVQHQFVVGRLALVEHVELALQKVE